MINIAKKDKRTNLEKEIDNVLVKLNGLSSDSKEYQTVSENLKRLYEAKSCERQRSISPDTIAVVAGNLLGIALILWHEKTEIITTKALAFIIKGRV